MVTLLLLLLLSAKSYLTFHDPMSCNPQDSSVQRISHAKIPWLPFPSPGHLPHPGIEPMSPALAEIFFTTEPPRKPHCLYGDKRSRSVVSDSLRPHGL